MLISDLLKAKCRNVITLIGSAQLGDAAQVMSREGIGAVVVVDAGGGLEGVLAEREVVRALTCGGGSVLCEPVSNWMRRGAPTVVPEARILEAVALITKARARHLPVVEKGVVVGLLSVGDLLNCRLEEKTQENLVLREVARWPLAESA